MGKVRLDKLLADSGYGSRKDVKKALQQGLVTVDGVTIKNSKCQIDPAQQSVYYRGMRVHYKEHVYVMMNKPAGVISATEDNAQQTVIDLIADEWGHKQMFPIGRLDKDTTGLLLLTTDGAYAHVLMAPKKHVTKRYRAVVDGVVDRKDQALFAQGVLLNDGYKTKPASLCIIESGIQSVVALTLTEGKFHQVKRMFAAVGKRVLELERTHIGSLVLDDTLPRGAYRELTEEEKSLARISNEQMFET